MTMKSKVRAYLRLTVAAVLILSVVGDSIFNKVDSNQLIALGVMAICAVGMGVQGINLLRSGER